MTMARTPRTRRGRGSPAIPPFQRFVEEHGTATYRFLMAMVGPGEADDSFQETFLAALRAYPRLRNGENLRSWILTIATRKGIDAARSRTRRPVAVAPEVVEAAAGAAGAARIADGAVEAGGRLWRAVQALPPQQRAAVVHRHVLDRSYADVAAALGCSEDAARANVYQGLKRLREVWRDGEGTVEDD
jgi:RNA polymerase sigma factor (sigma-70 family)